MALDWTPRATCDAPHAVSVKSFQMWGSALHGILPMLGMLFGTQKNQLIFLLLWQLELSPILSSNRLLGDSPLFLLGAPAGLTKFSGSPYWQCSYTTLLPLGMRGTILSIAATPSRVLALHSPGTQSSLGWHGPILCHHLVFPGVLFFAHIPFWSRTLLLKEC